MHGRFDLGGRHVVEIPMSGVLLLELVVNDFKDTILASEGR